MRIHTYTLPKRIIAMVLTLVMVLSVAPVLPLGTSATTGIDTAHTVADQITLDTWEEIFRPGGLPSTDYAGAVWTDKSVFTHTSLEAYDRLKNNGVGLINKDNFMVALSALATNSVVLGQDSATVDAVVVLDVSNSMSNQELEDMVKAADSAVSMLMEANEKSRVSVIVFGSTAKVLLPLRHYEGATNNNTTKPTFLTYYDSDIYPGAGYSRQNSSDNKFVGVTYYDEASQTTKSMSRNDRVSTGGGTYLQGGLWAAWEQFEAVSDQSIRDNNAVPAIILMGDGAPSFGTNEFDDVPSNATHGGGYTEDIDEGGGFATQLTAAYVKAKIAEKYKTKKALMYTVGFGLSTASGKEIATEVLNPTGTSDYWKTYNEETAVGETMTLTLCGDKKVSITKSATTLNPKYVDGFYAAEDANSLHTAFRNVVNEISLQTGYYPTRTDDNGANYSGYVTFSDTLGAGMEVVQVEGILLGNTLYSGIHMAQLLYNTDTWTKWLQANPGKTNDDVPTEFWLGTRANPTTLGDAFVRAVKTRLGIRVVPENETQDALDEARLAENNIAWALIDNAWQAEQLQYKADAAGNITAFSNYIGWYGDDKGDYVAPYPYKGDDAAILAKIEAKELFVNFDYGVLGAVNQDSRESDMMYVTVRLSKNQKTGERMVTFQIPAELMPTLTYKINQKLGQDGNPDPNNATISVNEATPIVLVYEVGVDTEAVNGLNIRDIGEKIIDPNDPNFGKYYLYASAWDNETDKDVLHSSLGNSMSYAHFEPSPENEHYFFGEDTPLVDKDGNPYKGTAHPKDTAEKIYFQDAIYTTDGTKDTEDAKAYVATLVTIPVEMNKTDLANAKQAADGSWYMPAGAMYARAYNYDLPKNNIPGMTGTTNKTGTHDYTHYHIVNGSTNATETDSYELMYQGNNGRMVYAPAPGLTLTKELAAGATALENETFTFTVTLSEDADGKVTITKGETSTEETLSGGKLTVSLKANETVTLWGVDTGAEYTITENISDENSYRYQVVKVNGNSVTEASGTITEYTLTPVVFTNDTIQYGEFTITKDVTYYKGATPVAGQTLPEFEVEVTLAGYAGRKVLVDAAETPVGADGKLTLTIKDNQTITISNVPVGTAYTVEEVGNLPGYTKVVGTGSGTVAEATTGVLLENSYTPTNVDPTSHFTISGTKYLRNAAAEPELLDEASEWNDLKFKIHLQYWDTSLATPAWVTLQTETVSFDKQTYSFTLDQDFEAVGVYAFRIYEEPETIEGVTYDQVRNVFDVTVTDDHGNGKLVISSVEARTNQSGTNIVVQKDTSRENAWTVTTDFHNIYDTVNATWTPIAVKVLEGRTLRAGEFQFRITGVKVTDLAGTELTGEPIPMTGLNLTENTYIMPNAMEGGNIVFPTVTFTSANQDKIYHYELTEVIPETGKVPGVTYDETKYSIAVKVTMDGNKVLRDVTVSNGTTPLGDGEEMIFTNTYKAASVTSTGLSAIKTLYDRTPGQGKYVAVKAEQFQFTLAALEGAPLPGNVTSMVLTNAAGTAADGAIITLPDITFKEAGQYQYTLTEINAGKGGYTYDSAKYTITITVEDNGNGALVIALISIIRNDTTPVNTMTFHNEYLAQPTEEIELNGIKNLDLEDPALTRTVKDGEFTFILSDANGEIERVTNVGSTFRFSKLKFTQAGTYRYTVTELPGNLGGVTYDGAEHELVIVVKDNGQGKLVAVNENDQAIEALQVGFTNEYNVSDATLHLTAIKSLTGRQLENGEFEFVLTALEGAPMPAHAKALNGSNGLVDFGSITYTKAGEYKYTIKETNNGLGGVTYDEVIRAITVTVKDNEHGALVASITSITGNPQNDLEFRNQYQAAPVKVELSATKNLENKTSGIQAANKVMTVTAKEFNFKLTALTQNAPMPAGSANGVYEMSSGTGVFTIPEITYTTTGTYQYTLQETAGDKRGYSYDDTKYTITVEITDNGSGYLQKNVSYAVGETSKPELIFNNSYSANPATPLKLSGTKILTNATPGILDSDKQMTVKKDQFSFTLTGPKVTGGSETVKNEEGGRFTFSQITFDALGTYVYTVEEKQKESTDPDYIAYDTAKYEVTVEVTDVGFDGQLDAAITKIVKIDGNNADTVQFENTYVAKPVTGIELEGNKELKDRPKPLQNEEFEFKLTGPNITGGSETVKNGADGSFHFSALEFNAIGVYNYTITEVHGGEIINGVKYDDAVYHVKVTVSDEGDGQLKAKVEYLDGPAAFVNTYKAGQSNPVSILGNKNLVDITGGGSVVMTPGNGDYSFELKDSDDKVEQTTSNNGSSFTFTDLTFEAAGIYKFTVSEVKGSKVGIIYDENTKYTVTITVTDDSKGNLTAVVDQPTIVFENKYEAKPATGIKIEAGKELMDITSNGDAKLTPMDGDFSFVLKDADGKEIETVKNVGSKVIFSDLTFEKTGEYKFTISEVQGDKDGIGYDDSVFNVTVNVTDPGNGELSAEVVYEKTPTFRNTYKAADATIVLAGKKTLTGGRELKENEFSFNLVGHGINTTVKNDADGNFEFPKLSFDTVGEYEYKMTEIAGTDSMVEYDKTTYDITVTVTYADGVMTAKAAVDGHPADSYSFTNIFTPEAAKVDIDVQKLLQNKTEKEMSLAGFQFQLTGEGKSLSAESNAEGIAKFSLSFDKVGTYTFQFTEVKGTVAGMTYDTSVQEVKVTVTQDSTTGELKASVEGQAVFTNIYADLPPKTADDFNLTGWMLMMSVSAVCLMAVIVLGKKKLAV